MALWGSTKIHASPIGGSLSISGGISVGSIVGHVVADISKWTGGLTTAANQIGGFTLKVDKFLENNAAAFRKMGIRMAATGIIITTAIGGMTKQYGNFEQRMRRAAAVSQYTEGQFKQMSDMAEKMSVKLNISATQAADAFYYLGSAGLSINEQMAAFPTVLSYAKAGVMEISDAAENLVDVMKGTGTSFDETTRVADILTKAITSSNATTSQLSESMGLVASIASDSNTPINEVAAAFGLMANAGVKGTNAGTALRRAFVNLSDPSTEMRQVMDSIGISAYDASGNMKSLAEVMVQVMEATEGSSQEVRKHAIATIFGTRAITGIQAILNVGAKGWRDYYESLKNSSGAMQEVVDKQMKSMNEQVGTLTQEIAKLSRHIGGTFVPTIRGLTEDFKPMIAGVTVWVDAHKSLVAAITSTLFSMGSLLVVGGLTLSMLGNMALIATGLGIGFTTLVVTLGTTTMAVTALVGALAFCVTKSMTLKKKFAELKSELNTGDEIEQIQKLIDKFSDLEKEAPKLRGFATVFELWRNELERQNETIQKVLNMTRQEMFKFMEENDMEISLMLGVKATPVVREYLINILESNKAIIRKKIDESEAEALNSLKNIKNEYKNMETEYMTVFEMAWNRREYMRNKEYEDWLRNNNLMKSEWSRSEYEMVVSTQEAMDTMESSMTEFFSNTMRDAKSWGDYLVSFMNSIAKAMTDMIAKQLTLNLMSSSWGNSIASSVFGIFGGGGNVSPALANTEGVGSTTVVPGFQTGGVITKPTFAALAEHGIPEAVIPLSEGRYIPVQMSGGNTPDIEINIVNNSQNQVSADKKDIKFDGKKLIIDAVVNDYHEGGRIRKLIG